MSIKVTVDVKLEAEELINIVQNSTKVGTAAVLAGAEKGAELVRQGIDTGRPEWQELSPITIERKGHDQILFDTGEMYDSINAESVGDNQAIYYTDDPKAPIHELGLLEGGTPSIPRRAMFEPTIKGTELQEIVDTVTEIMSKFYGGH